MTDNLTKHSKQALARIYLATLGGVELQVGTAGIHQLMCLGLVEFIEGRTSVTAWSAHYELTPEGLEACQDASMEMTLRNECHRHREDAQREVDEVEHQLRVRRRLLAGLNKAGRLLLFHRPEAPAELPPQEDFPVPLDTAGRARANDLLDALEGKGPGGKMNYAYADGYFAKHLEKMYGMTVDELRRELGRKGGVT